MSENKINIVSSWKQKEIRYLINYLEISTHRCRPIIYWWPVSVHPLIFTAIIPQTDYIFTETMYHRRSVLQVQLNLPIPRMLWTYKNSYSNSCIVNSNNNAIHCAFEYGRQVGFCCNYTDDYPIDKDKNKSNGHAFNELTGFSLL